MGILSAIGSAVSSVCSAIGSAFSSIGGGIASYAISIISPFPTLNVFMNIMKIIDLIVSGISELLGLKPEQETPEELGAKAEKADKKIEDFESTEKYIEYLRNEVTLDKDAVEKMSPEERAVYGSVGISLYAKGIEEKTGIALSPEFVTKAAQLEMNASEVKAYMDSFKQNGFTDMKGMSDYLTGKLDEKTDSKVESAIAQGLKNMNPGMSDKEIQTRLGAMTEKALNSEEN